MDNKTSYKKVSEETKKLIGQRINGALAYSNKQQNELATEMNINDNIVSYWCCGKRVPNCDELIAISKFCNVSLDYLLGRSKTASTDKDIQFICDYTQLNEEAICTLLSRALPGHKVNSIVLNVQYQGKQNLLEYFNNYTTVRDDTIISGCLNQIIETVGMCKLDKEVLDYLINEFNIDDFKNCDKYEIESLKDFCKLWKTEYKCKIFEVQEAIINFINNYSKINTISDNEEDIINKIYTDLCILLNARGKDNEG